MIQNNVRCIYTMHAQAFLIIINLKKKEHLRDECVNDFEVSITDKIFDWKKITLKALYFLLFLRFF